MADVKKFTLSFLHIILKIEKAAECLAFYINKLGMKELSSVVTGDTTATVLGFKDDKAQKTTADVCGCLELVSPNSRPPSNTLVNHGEKSGVYWKIGVTLPDVNTAVKQLQQQGVPAKPGSQFFDIGFMSHIGDPDDYAIELLQFTFDGKPLLPYDKLTSHPLRQQPVLAMVTLRVTDIEGSLRFYRDLLGMKLLCREDVTQFGFRLYFLAFTDETPPSNDVDAVVNREWTYQRPYTVLELQAYEEKQTRRFKELDDQSYGFMGLSFGCANVTDLITYLNAKGCPTRDYTEKHAVMNCPAVTVNDPDGVPIRFVQN